jgi:hypothetical protein
MCERANRGYFTYNTLQLSLMWPYFQNTSNLCSSASWDNIQNPPNLDWSSPFLIVKFEILLHCWKATPRELSHEKQRMVPSIFLRKLRDKKSYVHNRFIDICDFTTSSELGCVPVKIISLKTTESQLIALLQQTHKNDVIFTIFLIK